MMDKFLFILLLLFSFNIVKGVTYTSTQDGDWNVSVTWGGAGIPSNNNSDVIHIYHDVVMTGDITKFDSLVIHSGGSLIGNYHLEVKSGSYLEINGSLEVEDLTFNNGSEVVINGTVQVNGDLTNNNNSDDVIVNGYINVDGTLNNGNGGIITGAGSITAGTFTGPGLTFSLVNNTIEDGSTVPTSLPVELIYFRGDCLNYIIDLYWSTASETNNDYFIIEKSYNAVDWSDVALVVGNGNSNYTIDYIYTYYEDYNDVVYYRLLQTDFNGAYEYFDIISVNCISDNIYLIVPNPISAGSTLHVTNLLEGDELQIYTNHGQLLTNFNLTSGFYYVFVNKKFIGKLIVQ